MLELSSLSFAHPRVDASSRARLALAGSALRGVYDRLASAGSEVFVLSTCLRVEVAWIGGLAEAEGILDLLWGDRSDIPDGATRRDEAAFLHLCRISAGLESPLIGEPEVLGQFRQSASMFRDVADPLGDMARVLDAAIAVGRSTRRRLGQSPRGSLASVAVEAAAGLEPIAVLGSGAMARATVERLGGRRWEVFARRSTQVAGRDTHPWQDVERALTTYPAVISTVPGKSRLLTEDAVVRALAARSQPLLLIDLGMPPAFAPVNGNGVTYLGVDELASSVAPAAAIGAERLIAESAAVSWTRLAAAGRVGEVIASIIGRAEAAAAEEAERFGRRLTAAADPSAVLAQLARTVARRVVHDPVSYVGATADGEAIDTIATAFGLSDE